MKRVVLLAVSLIVPALAAAQVPPPPPPPAPAAPVVAPAVPVPAPMPRVFVAPTVLDRADFEDYIRSAMDAARAIDVESVRDAAMQAARSVDTQAVREATAQARVDAERVREQAQIAREDAFRIREMPEWHFDYQERAVPMMAGMGPQDAESSSYNAGLSLIQQRQYDQAIIRFDRDDRPEGRARRRRLVLEGVRAVQGRQERRRLGLDRRAPEGLSAEPLSERREGARGRRPQAAPRSD